MEGGLFLRKLVPSLGCGRGTRHVEGIFIEQHWDVQSWQQVHRMNHIYTMQYACMLSNFFNFA